jgi:hypothetical protein
MKALLEDNLAKHFKSYSGKIFRLVEGQHFISTRKLVDSDDEQRLLEEILDAAKPLAPTSNKRGDLHYLLYTPFRYPPLQSGSRFHTRLEQSIFYGAEDLQTAMAEIAYGRFLFMRHSAAELKPIQVPYTHFVAKVKSQKSLHLTEAPFSKYKSKISHKSSYAEAQRLGAVMRNFGTELFTYFSARNANGINVGLFSVEAFAQNKPVAGCELHWSVFITAKNVEFRRAHLLGKQREVHVFSDA